MDSKALIESYVGDVIRLLPRRQRNDVGFELRALLNEELQGKADEAGRAPDEAMTLDLLQAFGRPEDVADRYRPTGHPIVEARHARTFTTLALGGVALQWAVSLPYVLSRGAPLDPLSRLGAWWLTGGLGALWWPGFLVVVTMVAGWVGRRWPDTSAWRPRTVDRDRVNRPGWALALAFFITGAAVLILLPWLIDQLFAGRVAENMQRALAYDPAFRSTRGPWLLPVWAGHMTLLGVVIVHGRWTRLTRRIDMALSLAISGLMAWFIAAGPIFQARPADDMVKLVMVLILLAVLIDIGVKLYRQSARIRTPVLASPPGV